MTKKKADIYVINDYAMEFNGILRLKLTDFTGQTVADLESPVRTGPTQAARQRRCQCKRAG